MINEKDPTGRTATDPGAKLDAGKAWAYLLRDFGDALWSVNMIDYYSRPDDIDQELLCELINDPSPNPPYIVWLAVTRITGIHGEAGFIKDNGPALLEVAEILTRGAQKYSPHGWRSVPNGVFRYYNAMIRHLLKESIEDRDADGLLHRACVAWNALAVLELMLSKHAGRELADVLEEQMAAVWAEETSKIEVNTLSGARDGDLGVISGGTIEDSSVTHTSVTTGCAVYDPRTKTHISSANPALVMADMVKQGYLHCEGWDLESDRLWEKIGALADFCDGEVGN